MALSDVRLAVLRIAFKAFEPADGIADKVKLVEKLNEFGMSNDDAIAIKLRETLEEGLERVRVQDFVTLFARTLECAPGKVLTGQGFDDMGLAVLRAAFSQLSPNKEGLIRKQALADALEAHGVSVDASDFQRLCTWTDGASFPEFAAALALLDCQTPTPSPRSPIDVVSLLDEVATWHTTLQSHQQLELSEDDSMGALLEDYFAGEDPRPQHSSKGGEREALWEQIAGLQARQLH